jgi:hypothetical protein
MENETIKIERQLGKGRMKNEKNKKGNLLL